MIIPGDKDSCIVIMNKADYHNKLQEMIDDGIKNGTYTPTEDQTLLELKRFKDFLYGNFKNFEHYEKMIPPSSQPARLYGTAKTHKFTDIKNIDCQNSAQLLPKPGQQCITVLK